jgi:hypothetical protein
MFSVIWNVTVLDRLADLYVAATAVDRQQMADGIEALNRRRADDPLAVGESRGGNARVAFPDLLIVRYRVDAAAGVVRVVGVSRYGR